MVLTKKWAVKYWLIYWSRCFENIDREPPIFWRHFVFCDHDRYWYFQNIIAVGTDTVSYWLILTGICQYFEPWRKVKWLDPNGNCGDVNTIRFGSYLLIIEGFLTIVLWGPMHACSEVLKAKVDV